MSIVSKSTLAIDRWFSDREVSEDWIARWNWILGEEVRAANIFSTKDLKRGDDNAWWIPYYFIRLFLFSVKTKDLDAWVSVARRSQRYLVPASQPEDTQQSEKPVPKPEKKNLTLFDKANSVSKSQQLRWGTGNARDRQIFRQSMVISALSLV